MGLTNENVGPKILAKIKIYVLTRAELLFTLCYEIPCIRWVAKKTEFTNCLILHTSYNSFSVNFARRPSIRKTLWTCIYENILEKNLTNVNFVRCHSLKMEIYVHISNVCTVLKQMNHFWDVMSAAVLSKRYLN